MVSVACGRDHPQSQPRCSDTQHRHNRRRCSHAVCDSRFAMVRPRNARRTDRNAGAASTAASASAPATDRTSGTHEAHTYATRPHDAQRQNEPQSSVMRLAGLVAPVVGLAIFAKVLLAPAYFSTDLEVHRYWLALTTSLPPSKWYYDTSSPWTLDYPPLFALFQWLIALPARVLVPEMLNVHAHNLASWRVIAYLRASVIIAELPLYCVATRLLHTTLGISDPTRFRLKLAAIVLHPGIFIVDNIHFQYNGLLYAFVLLIIDCAIRGRFIALGIVFATLINLKHIYLYQALAVFIFILSDYVFAPFSHVAPRQQRTQTSSTSSPNTSSTTTTAAAATVAAAGTSGSSLTSQPRTSSTIATRQESTITLWITALLRTIAMGFAVLLVFSVSVGPFLPHWRAILGRLFPFGRGLCHAYWAPNVWALYAATDWALDLLLKTIRAGCVVKCAVISKIPILNVLSPYLEPVSRVFKHLFSERRTPGIPITSGQVHQTKFSILPTPSAAFCGILTALVQIIIFAIYLRKEQQRKHASVTGTTATTNTASSTSAPTPAPTAATNAAATRVSPGATTASVTSPSQPLNPGTNTPTHAPVSTRWIVGSLSLSQYLPTRKVSDWKTLTNLEKQARLRRVVAFLTVGSWVSFLFGYHVHEKAVLLFVIPLATLVDQVPKGSLQQIAASPIFQIVRTRLRRESSHVSSTDQIANVVSHAGCESNSGRVGGVSSMETSNLVPDHISTTEEHLSDSVREIISSKFAEDRDPGYESSSDEMPEGIDDDLDEAAFSGDVEDIDDSIVDDNLFPPMLRSSTEPSSPLLHERNVDLAIPAKEPANAVNAHKSSSSHGPTTTQQGTEDVSGSESDTEPSEGGAYIDSSEISQVKAIAGAALRRAAHYSRLSTGSSSAQMSTRTSLGFLTADQKEVYLGQLRLNKWFLNLSFVSTISLLPLLFRFDECIIKYGLLLLYHVIMKVLLVGGNESTNTLLDLDLETFRLSMNSTAAHNSGSNVTDHSPPHHHLGHSSSIGSLHLKSGEHSTAGPSSPTFEHTYGNRLYAKISFIPKKIYQLCKLHLSRFLNRGSLPRVVLLLVLYSSLVADAIQLILQVPMTRDGFGVVHGAYAANSPLADLGWRSVSWTRDPSSTVSTGTVTEVLTLCLYSAAALVITVFNFLYNALTILRHVAVKIEFLGLLSLSTTSSIGILMSFTWFIFHFI